MRRFIRLLRYSISGWDMFPIFLDYEMAYSTTAVLDLRMGQALYSLKRISSSTRLQPVDYSGQVPYLQDGTITHKRLLQYSNNLSVSCKGTTRPRDDNIIDYYNTRRNNSRQPMTSFMKRQPANRPSNKRKKYYTTEY